MTGQSADGLLGPAEVRAIAAELDVHPSKRLGQNFVIDPNTVRRIVRLADLSSADSVLEVGPGIGSLTLGLLPACHTVTAVEIDPQLAARLPETAVERLPELAPRLRVVAADALQLTSPLPGPPPTALVANLPYNVAVPVLLTLLQQFASIRSALVMVQLEVAERLVAGPGSRVYGVPSVKLAWFGRARKVGTVAPSVFWPAPRVDSGLVGFERHRPPLCSADRTEVFSCVDAAFGQRRKGLRSALAGWAGGADNAQEVLRSAGIAPTERGEALTIADFARLADARSSLFGP